jgi:hypothetical protein
MAVIDHDIQEKSVHVNESGKEVDLGHTAHVRDGLAAYYVIYQHLGDSD